MTQTKPYILALATAVPDYSEDQLIIGEKIADFLNPSDKIKQQIKDLYANSGIKRRYSVLRDIQLAWQEFEFFGAKTPSTYERNKVYKQEAPKLAMKAVTSLLAQYQRDKNEITHIISISCTGMMAPGIEFLIQQTFNLNPTIQRLGINFMGCFGAFKGLAIAAALAQQSPQHRILVVCTELCSLHFQTELNPEILVGNALFSDGAAAVMIGTDCREYEEPLWEIENFASYALPDSLNKMSWEVCDTGFLMGLSRQVPVYILKNITTLIAQLNPDNKKIDQWAIHPGGKKIVEAIERSCELTREQTQSAWHVLENYGNMSSATFLFVLAELCASREGLLIGLGFGPGLSCEGVMLNAVGD